MGLLLLRAGTLALLLVLGVTIAYVAKLLYQRPFWKYQRKFVLPVEMGSSLIMALSVWAAIILIAEPILPFIKHLGILSSFVNIMVLVVLWASSWYLIDTYIVKCVPKERE